MIESVKHRKCPFKVGGQLWFQKNEQVFLFEETVDLLVEIDRLGSISKAAKQVGVSYQKAWGLIDLANRFSRLPIVVRKKGGVAGGGATLTNHGRLQVVQFRAIQNELRKFLAGFAIDAC